MFCYASTKNKLVKEIGIKPKNRWYYQKKQTML